MTRLIPLLAAGCIFTAPANSAPAWPDYLDVDFSYRQSARQQEDRHWDLRLGAGIEREPTFQGSDRYDTEPDLFVVAAYRRDWGNVFLTTGGLGFSRLLSESFGIQIQLEAEDTREEGDDDRLEGMGDQDEELELEIVGRYFLGPWQAGGSVAFATGDKGTVWFLGGGYTWRGLGERLFLSLSSDLSGSDEDNQQTDFGVTPEQSAASVSGYPVYSPDGGLKSFGLRLNADYRINERWYLYGELDYERLLSDVADSPLVTMTGSENNVEAAIGFYYRF